MITTLDDAILFLTYPRAASYQLSVTYSVHSQLLKPLISTNHRPTIIMAQHIPHVPDHLLYYYLTLGASA